MSKVPKSNNNKKKSKTQDSATDWYDKGMDYKKSKKYEKALDCFKKVVEIDPQYKGVWFYIGWAYSELCEAQKLPEDPFDAILSDDIPYIGEKDMEFIQKIIDSYEKAVSLEPDEYNAWYNLGRQYSDSLHNYEKAIECYKKAIEYSPKFSEAWNNLGLCYDKLKNYKKAVECYENAVKFGPENDVAWVNLGIVSYFLKNYERSMECYGKGIELNPMNYNARNSMHAAMESIQKKVELNIRNKNLWIKMGVNYLKIIEFQKSIKCFKQIIEIDPQDFDAWHNIGIAYHQLNDHQKFLDCFEKPAKLLKDLKRVSIITTDQGPIYPDVFWLLESSSEIGVIPSEGPDSEFLLKVQDLPGFDNDEVIKGMSSTEDKIFVCWEKKK